MAAKRKSYEIRDEHIQAGAVCIEVDYKKPFALPGVAELKDEEKNLQWGRGDPKKTYATMERKGFRFTTDTGCFAPIKRFTLKSGGANERGYQLSFFNKYGFMLAQLDLDDTSASEALIANESLQLSHRCHRRWCCRLDHLVVEMRWRNAARNFCLGPVEVDLPGRGKTKTCGCSLQYHYAGKPELAGPPCLRAWSPSPSEVPVDIGEMAIKPGDVKTLLDQTVFPFNFRFVVWDARKVASQNRQKRVELKASRGAKLAIGLAEAGLASPDLTLSKKARLVDAEKVPFDGNPKRLAYIEYDSDDDFEQPPAKKAAR
jgi:hypothetical protein